MAPGYVAVAAPISTRSARGGGDSRVLDIELAPGPFQPAPPVGAETPYPGPPIYSNLFQPAPPVGAETRRVRSYGGELCLFQPTPPVGAETKKTLEESTLVNFNPLRPWGRRPARSQRSQRWRKFQPTPPVGAETPIKSSLATTLTNFNPLRPWGRRHNIIIIHAASVLISTHSARGGGDCYQCRLVSCYPNFNPLRPWGRRLAIAQGLLNAVIFQPTPPVGAETQTKITITEDKLFQPTPPVGAETRRFRPSNTRNDISTHSARGGGDGRISP